jgi:hypothetical protein
MLICRECSFHKSLIIEIFVYLLLLFAKRLFARKMTFPTSKHVEKVTA